MGCAVSTALTCLLCSNKCSIERVSAKFAFFPPSPASYSFSRKAPQDGEGWEIVFDNPDMQEAASTANAAGISVKLHKLATSRNEQVALLHFIHPRARKTVIWSHGNAMDIGEMYFFFMQLCMALEINLMAYDYSGYGASTGEPSEPNCYADIQAVYDFLRGLHVRVIFHPRIPYSRCCT